jgi:hypothetical protein
MATINLGSIKFNWKGTYAGGTAYVVDDVVEYNGSSYICILASTGNLPTNTTYFEQMSSAGTNGTDGTDLGTTLTTQGDILYRDGSGLQRLAKGTASQVLAINSGATAPEWVNPSGGKILQVKFNTPGTTQYSTTSGSYVDVGAQYQVVITPTSATSRMLIHAQFALQSNGNRAEYDVQKSGDTGGTVNVSATSNGTATGAGSISNNEQVGTDGNGFNSFQWIDEIGSTNQLTYKLRHKIGGGHSISTGVASSCNYMYVMELAGDIF